MASLLKGLPTFKSLPSAIGLPFLSSAEDAQLKFRCGDNGIKRLYGEEVIPVHDVEYWSQYYRVFNSAPDVYSLITVQDVRQTLTSQPANLASLILHLSRHIFTLIPSPLFPSSSSSQQDTVREALNCLRVLGRLIVVVYEAEADAREGGVASEGEETFAQKYLWSRAPPATPDLDGADIPKADLNYEGQQFKIEDSDSDEEDAILDEGARAFKAVVGNPPTSTDTTPVVPPDETLDDPLTRANPPQTGDQSDAEQTVPCLVDRLFSCTIDLLFCAGFSLPDSVKGQGGHDDKINYVIWEKGIGSTVHVGTTSELDRNKTEVLRFLLILLSSTIYTPPHALHTSSNLPLETLTHSLERRLVLSLLCSWLNTSLTPSKATASLGGQVPYSHLVSKAAEEKRTLIKASLTALLVALDHDRPELQPHMGQSKDDNAFRYFVSKLHRKEDFAFILNGVLGILEEHAAVTNLYLPGSKRPVPYILETYMLLWRMIDLNKRFRAYLFESSKALDIVVHALVTCLDFKDDPAHHGLLRLLSYLLQTLSADQAFASALNQTIRMNVPAKWAVIGTAADFMIVSIYSIATTPGLNPLFPALTISIANVAPHLSNIGVQASTRLLQLFKAFSAPNFLLADEGHPRLVYYLLETFNSVLYHKMNENPHLVYAILRSHQDFQTLATFSLISGLRDIQRRKMLRVSDVSKVDSQSIKRTQSELDMLAEKAALLGRDGTDLDDVDEEQSPSGATNARPVSPEAVSVSLYVGDDTTTDPLHEPSTQLASPPLIPVAMSEKAKGKQRATDSDSTVPNTDTTADVPDEQLLKVAQAGVGPNGYVPTQEWVFSWQKGLPLDPVLVAISELLPRIQDSTSRVGAPSTKVFNILKGASLENVLPPALPIVPRKFQWSPASCIWLTSLLWGDIYVSGLTSVGIWRDTTVRLFSVKQAPARGRQAQVERILKKIGVV